MSNRLGAALAAGIVGLGAIGVYVATPVRADVVSDDSPAFDCRYMGNRVCGADNAQGVMPGWYGDMDCWPGAVYCPDIDGPYDPAIVRPGMFKAHTFDDDGNDLGPSVDLHALSTCGDLCLGAYVVTDPVTGDTDVFTPGNPRIPVYVY